MAVRRWIGLVVLVLAATFPRPVAAAPIQINFTGQWRFHDPHDDVPEFWDAMSTVGVTEGSSVWFSLIVNNTDRNPDPNIGTYTVAKSLLSVGDIEWTVGARTTLDVFSQKFGADISWFGAPIGNGPSGWSPDYLQLDALALASPLLSDDLESALAHLGDFPYTNLYMGFGGGPIGCGICLGVAGLTLTSIEQVPELSSGTCLVGGLIGLFAWRQRYRVWVCPGRSMS